MSRKQQRSITISAENDDWLGQTGRNASELIDHLVTQYRKHGDISNAVEQLRREQIQSEIDSLQTQIEQKQTELTRIEEREQKREEQEVDAWEKSLSELQFTTLVGETIIDSPDTLIERRADEHGLTAEEFKQEAIDRWEARDA